MNTKTALTLVFGLLLALGCDGAEGGTGSGGAGGAAGTGGTDDPAPPRPSLAVDPSELAFEGFEGASDPSPEIVAVSNHGDGTLECPTVALAYASGDDWLSTSVAPTAPYRIVVQPRIGALAPGEYRATLEVTSEGAEGSPRLVRIALVVHPRPVTLTTGQAADVVLGQADFISRHEGREPSASTIAGPWGNPTISGGKLYLPDSGNHRVLVFEGVPHQNGTPAAWALGQPDLETAERACLPERMAGAGQVSVGEGKSGVADPDNDRYLIWNTVPEACGVPADVALGQRSLDSCSSAACNETSLSRPSGGAIAGGRVIVVDSGNHRVLVWNTIPTASGAPADLVLGQPDLRTCRDGLSSSGLFAPSAVWSDGQRLLVVDWGNRRVLLWRTFPTVNGQPADLVLGQRDFDTAEAVADAVHFGEPLGVSSNGAQIAVADFDFNRVLVWNSIPTANGAPADVVLGRPDFGSVDDDIEGLPTAATLSGPTGVTFVPGGLVVADFWNDRYLIYR